MVFLALLCGVLAFAAPAAPQQKLPRWSLTAELRIGAIDGPDALDAIGDIVVSPATGQIFVTERSQRILVFDDRGRRVGAWGRQGDGPGEFQNLQDVFWTDGSIAATDGRSLRITRFTENGEVVDAGRIESDPLTSTGSRARVIAPLGEDAYLGRVLEEAPDGPLVRTRMRLVRIDVNGRDSILDTAFTADSWLAVERGMLGIPQSAGTAVGIHPHGKYVVLVYLPYQAADESPTFRIRKISEDGSVVFARTYAYAPVRREDGYVQKFVAARREGIQALGLSTREAERLVSRYMSPYLPAIREVEVGVDGTIWLKREEETGDLVWWHVLDERGDPAAILRLRRRLRIGHVDGDTLWGIETDELGVYYLVKYRVVR